MDHVFRRWGTDTILQQDGKEYRFRGMLQHSGSKSKQNAQRQFSSLGQVARGQYVYIGPAFPAPCVGDSLIVGGMVYELRQAEQVMLGNRPMYCWGLCVRKGGAGA